MTLRTMTTLALLAYLGTGLVPSAHAEPSPPPEQESPAMIEARQHFKLGVDFYREQNFRAALIEFQRAYKASAHYKLLYNLGQASLELREDSAAMDYFTRYLREGGNELTAERRQEVEREIVRLQARMGNMTVTSNQEGAEVYLDDTLIGTTPLASSVRVGVGRRRIVAVKAGFSNVDRVLDVAAGDQVQVALNFSAQPAAADEVRTSPTYTLPESDGELHPAVWAGIATGAVAAGAVTLTILTVLAQNKYEDEIGRETTKSKLDDRRDDAKTKALVADILWGATVVGAGVTTVLLFTAGSAERRPETGLRLDVGPGNVRLHGSF